MLPNRAGQRPDAPLTRTEKEHRDQLIDLLRLHRGSVSEVARALGKGRTQVHRWLKRYGLELADYRL